MTTSPESEDDKSDFVYLPDPSGEDLDVYQVAIRDSKGNPWILRSLQGNYCDSDGKPLESRTLRGLIEIGAIGD